MKNIIITFTLAINTCVFGQEAPYNPDNLKINFTTSLVGIDPLKYEGIEYNLVRTEYIKYFSFENEKLTITFENAELNYPNKVLDKINEVLIQFNLEANFESNQNLSNHFKGEKIQSVDLILSNLSSSTEKLNFLNFLLSRGIYAVNFGTNHHVFIVFSDELTIDQLINHIKEAGKQVIENEEEIGKYY